MAEKFLYRMNDTMELLGHQRVSNFAAGHEMMNEVFKAHKAKGTNNYYDVAIDAFALGFILGKRAERAKKKCRTRGGRHDGCKHK